VRRHVELSFEKRRDPTQRSHLIRVHDHDRFGFPESESRHLISESRRHWPLPPCGGYGDTGRMPLREGGTKIGKEGPGRGVLQCCNKLRDQRLPPPQTLPHCHCCLLCHEKCLSTCGRWDSEGPLEPAASTPAQTKYTTKQTSATGGEGRSVRFPRTCRIRSSEVKQSITPITYPRYERTELCQMTEPGPSPWLSSPLFLRRQVHSRDEGDEGMFYMTLYDVRKLELPPPFSPRDKLQ
jgi:hypothetical protein